MPKLARKEANRERLLDQGVDMLMRQGYHGTGLQEILDATGIPKGSFYNYFDSKEDFGASVIEHYIDPFIVRLTAHLKRSEGDALGAIRRYFDELIAEFERDGFNGGCLLGNLMGEIGDTSPLCRKSLHAALDRYRALLASGLALAQQQGAVRTDRSATDMADLLINTWQGALLRGKIERSATPARQCCANLLDDFFKA